MADATERPNLLTDEPARALWRLATPTLLGIVFILLVNLVDTYFVGQLGTAELAAMGFTFPIATLVMSVGFGLGVGTTSAVSRALGGGDSSGSRRLVTHGLILGGAVVIAISLLGVATQDLVFRSLGAPEELLPILSAYMTIWYAGAAFLVVPMIGTGALRASGDAKTPAVIMAVAAASNAVLDPILIFGFGPIEGMGIEGAAIATVFSRAVTLAAALWVLSSRKLLEWHWPSVAELRGSAKKILSVGIPVSIGNAIVPVATAVMTALIATYGPAAVASYGVASRLESFVLIPAMALTAALTPFIGQNWGGHRPERVATAIAISSRFVFVWGLGAWAILLTFGDAVAGVFTDDAAVIDGVHTYMWIVPAGYGAAGLVSVVSASFNAVDRAVRSTLLSALKSLVLAVPLAFAGEAIAGLRGIFAGLMAANLITAVAAMAWSRSLRRAPKPVDAPLTSLRGMGEREPLIGELVDAVQGAATIQVCPRPINTLGFYAANHELGHVHATGHIDLHVPPEVHDVLLDLGKCEHHRHLHDVGWITHRVDSSDDVPEVEWLLRLTSALHDAITSEAEPSDEAFDALDLDPKLRRAVEHAVSRARAA